MLRARVPQGWRAKPKSRSLLVSERLDGVEARGLDGGIHPEEDADASRKAEPNGKGPPGERNGEARDQVNSPADTRAQGDPEHAAHQREEGGLGEELEEDLRPSCTKRLADADLTGSLRHRD